MNYQACIPNQSDMKWIRNNLLGVDKPRFPSHFAPRGSSHNHSNHLQRGARNNKFQSINYNNKGFRNQRVGLQDYCSNCDIYFDNSYLYDLHIKDHVKCKGDGCTYEAEEVIVDMHFKLEHLPNFVEKEENFPEDIEEYKMQRRKNFPTARKVAEKKALIAEKNLRGEVLQTQQFGKFKKRHHQISNKRVEKRGRFDNEANNSYSKRQFPNKSRRRQRKPRNIIQEESNNSDCEAVHPIWGLKKFGGMECGTEIIKDEGDITDSDNDINPVLNNGALQFLSQCYQTSSDDENEEKEGKCASTSRTCDNLIGTLQPTPIQVSPPTPILVPPQKAPQQKINVSSISNLKTRSEAYKHRFTLLEMLLAPDIRHERNTILQCIRFIVEQNFFQK